jgi:hypothetical protein
LKWHIKDLGTVIANGHVGLINIKEVQTADESLLVEVPKAR